MFFILSKVLFYLLMPLTWILALLLYSIFTKKEKRRKRALVTATVLLLFFTNSFLANEAWLLWESPPTPVSQVKMYDAAIILTGFTNQTKTPYDRTYTRRGADRMLHTLQLYKAGHFKTIIITGGSGSLTSQHNTEAAQIKRLLLHSGVPDSAILLEKKSRNTYENAQFTKALLQQHLHLQKLLLVTSAFHMRRAKGCFKKAGVQAHTFSTDFYTTDRQYGFDTFLIPEEVNLYHWQKLIHEMLGYAVYKVMGYC